LPQTGGKERTTRGPGGGGSLPGFSLAPPREKSRAKPNCGGENRREEKKNTKLLSSPRALDSRGGGNQKFPGGPLRKKISGQRSSSDPQNKILVQGRKEVYEPRKNAHGEKISLPCRGSVHHDLLQSSGSSPGTKGVGRKFYLEKKQVLLGGTNQTLFVPPKRWSVLYSVLCLLKNWGIYQPFPSGSTQGNNTTKKTTNPGGAIWLVL